MSSKTLGELDEDLVRQGYLPADRVAQCAHARAAAADRPLVEGATAAAVAAMPEAQGAAAAAAAAVPKVQAPGAAAAPNELRRIEQEERPWCCCAIGTEFHQQPYTFVASRGAWTFGYQSLVNNERLLPENPDRIPLKYISVLAGSRGNPPQDYQGC